jgi:hypothetical protein
MWLFFAYFDSRPRVPKPELGLIHALNNHGSYVFISDTEATGLALLTYAFLVAFGLFIAIVPKQFQLPPAGTPRWITRTSARFTTDLEKPTQEYWIIFAASLAGWTLVFLLSGHRSFLFWFRAVSF